MNNLRSKVQHRVWGESLNQIKEQIHTQNRVSVWDHVSVKVRHVSSQIREQVRIQADE